MNNNDSELKNSYNFLELKASNLQPDISSLIQHENDKRIRFIHLKTGSWHVHLWIHYTTNTFLY